MIKKHYEIPESELLLVKFEENFCQSPNGVRSDSSSSGYDDENDLGTI